MRLGNAVWRSSRRSVNFPLPIRSQDVVAASLPAHSGKSSWLLLVFQREIGPRCSKKCCTRPKPIQEKFENEPNVYKQMNTLLLFHSLLRIMIPFGEAVRFSVDVLRWRVETDITSKNDSVVLPGFSKDENKWSGRDRKPWRWLRLDVIFAWALAFESAEIGPRIPAIAY